MESCLLCLEINKDILDCIKVNTTKWKEFNIENTIAKHFWPLNATQTGSSICLSCWREVEGFHKFYMRIEEAHINFGKIKMEIQIDEEHQCNLAEPDILIDRNQLPEVLNLKDCSVKQEGDNDDLNESSIICKDPLKKRNVSNRKSIQNLKAISLTTNNSDENELFPDVKKEMSDSDNDNTTDEEDDDYNYEADKDHKEYKNRKEGDKFIAEHFKQIFCDLCDVPFENFTDMKKHFFTIHSIRKGYLVCCNRKFYRRNHLVDHLQCHLNPDHFKCKQCGKILSDRINLRNHMLRVHRPEDVAAKHSCDICGKSFIMAYLLRTHKLLHLAKEEKKFHCAQCGKFYASSYSLKVHTEVIHLKKQSKICYICGKTLGNSTEYKAHINKHAGIPAPVINCDVCGLRLISERSLKLHKESQHPVGGKKDHPCPICEKVSPTARALKKHINTMHEKGFDHKCTMCEKAFRRAEALKEHMASHTGTPLYSCPWCPKTFNSNGNMYSHRKNKHPQESLKLYMQKYN